MAMLLQLLEPRRERIPGSQLNRLPRGVLQS
jgi:hypothetical protein